MLGHQSIHSPVCDKEPIKMDYKSSGRGRIFDLTLIYGTNNAILPLFVKQSTQTFLFYLNFTGK